MNFWDPYEGFSKLRKSIFHVEARWEGDGGGHDGTAFLICRLENSRRLVLATARHVLQVPSDRLVVWKFSQRDEHGNVTREFQFSTHGSSTRDFGIRTHTLSDVAVIALPARSDCGEVEFDLPLESLAPVAPQDRMRSEGTTVFWAGYPDIVLDLLKKPMLTMFQGVIALTVNSTSRHLYLVDGHMRQGVSGGPLWCYDHVQNRVEVIGIASGYIPGDELMLPGLCQFEPINDVLQYLRTWGPTKSVSGTYGVMSTDKAP